MYLVAKKIRKYTHYLNNTRPPVLLALHKIIHYHSGSGKQESKAEGSSAVQLQINRVTQQWDDIQYSLSSAHRGLLVGR